MTDKFDVDDRRLTAYVLGELSEDERVEIEAELARNEAARETVAEIQAMAGLLTRELQQEPAAELSPGQRAAVLRGPERKARTPRFGLLPRFATALAAGLVLVAGAVYLSVQQRGRLEPALQIAKVADEEAESSRRARKAPTPPAPVAKESATRGERLDQPAPSVGDRTVSTAPIQPVPPKLELGFVTRSEVAPLAAPSAPKEAFFSDKVAGVEEAVTGLGVPVSGVQLHTEQAEKPKVAVLLPKRVSEADVTTEQAPLFRPLNMPVGAARGGGMGGGGGAMGGMGGGGVGGASVHDLRTQGGQAAMVGGGIGDGLRGGGVTSNGQFGVYSDQMTVARNEGERLRALGYITRKEDRKNVKGTTLQAPFFGQTASGEGVGSERLVIIRNLGDAREKLDAAIERRLHYELPDDGSRGAGRSEGSGTETYEFIVGNPFRKVADAARSTFSIDVDTASYANVRRFLNQGQLPPKPAVRIEEMVNYFAYDYPQPKGDVPFSVNVEVAACPWKPEHKLARVGLKSKDIQMDDRPAANLVFLLDVSGSMKDENKLPLLKKAMALLVKRLGKSDRVAIVTYANDARLVLDSTAAGKKQTILNAIDRLNASGGTNGAAGIAKAYDIAADNFVKGGINRVILATDGDFNVGVTERSELVDLIEDRAGTGVFLTVLGFGTGNLKDANLEALADKGNGHYAYIDAFNEARKVLMEQVGGTFFTIAKDVKIQIEFNPGRVDAYRLIGYENRVLADRDFSDDRKDAGEIGAGHTVTALYELVPRGLGGVMPGVDPLKYQKPPETPDNVVKSDDLMTVRLRYKALDEDTSKLSEVEVPDTRAGIEKTSGEFKFAAAVAGFGMLLRDSDYMGDTSFDLVLELARAGRGADEDGYRAEFIGLVKTARALRTK